MPRLFTGFALPPEVADDLARYRGGLSGARWVDPSDYHVTLRFLGDVDNATAQDVHDRLVLTRRTGPVTIAFDGLAAFGGNKPHAIIASVAGDPTLTEIQGEHERIARGAGLPPEHRRFTPHVTLARLKRGTAATDVAGHLAQAGLFTRLDFRADAVCLYSARESRGGGPYIVEAAYPLVAAPQALDDPAA